MEFKRKWIEAVLFVAKIKLITSVVMKKNVSKVLEYEKILVFFVMNRDVQGVKNLW